MGKYILLPILLLISSCNHSQSKESEFESTVYKVVKAFENRNEQAINKMVSPNDGISIVATDDNWVISFTETLFHFPNPMQHKAYYQPTKSYKLNYDSLPFYDEKKDEWSKKAGLYCDTTIIDYTLAREAACRMRYDEDGQPLDEGHKSVIDFEQQCRKIIYLGEDGIALGFSLIYEKEKESKSDKYKWSIVIVDTREKIPSAHTPN